MILDATSILSQNQAITVTAASTGVYDTAGLGVGQPVTNIFGLATVGSNASFGQDIGDAGPGAGGSSPQLMALITTAFTAGGSATMQVQLQAAVDTNNNSGTPGTWETIIETDTLAVALLTAGRFAARFDVPGRYLGQGFPRFYRLNFVIATGPMTAGSVTSALLTGIDANPLYPANY